MRPSIVVQEQSIIHAGYRTQRHRAAIHGLVILAFALAAIGWLHGQDALHIDDKGNVGIGKNKPEGKLDVNGDMFLKGPLGIGGIDLGNKIFLWSDIWGFGMQGYQLQVFMPYAVKGQQTRRSPYDVSEDTARIAFGWGPSNLESRRCAPGEACPKVCGDNFDCFHELMRIQADGSVGIGIENPAAKLDVNGDESVRGKITAQTAAVDGNLTAKSAAVTGELTAKSATVTTLNATTLAVTSGRLPLVTLFVHEEGTLQGGERKNLSKACPSDYHLLSGFCGANVDNADAKYTTVNYSGPGISPGVPPAGNNVIPNPSVWVCSVTNTDGSQHGVQVGALCAK